ncbi:hypothetical protein EGW08_022809 [Elysia chlorotica]|uniref:Purine nucleoside phosphorylase n=1 Tax=Elysia chlorotica TaxID=188477 RepID=A0A3S1B168_ELYCH|nr:hypothetical protein EGW08_022809 [Elysia chlorotica]
MALWVGAKLYSFDDVNRAVKKFEEDNWVNLYCKDSRTIEAAAKRCPNKVYRSSLKYAEISYACVRNGKYKSMVTTGERPNQSTIRSGCQFAIKLRSYDGQSLRVSSIGPAHNHECKRNDFMHHPSQRRLEKKGIEKSTAENRRMATTGSDMSTSGYSFEDIHAMAEEILKYSPLRPKIGIICGTGLGGIADVLENPVPVPYEVIPGFPVSTVKGHSGKFVFGTIQGKPILLMMGRLHYYEGYPMWKVAMPVRVMKAIGVETLLITNAAGGLDPKQKAGDLMIIKDHIDFPGLTGECVLIGKNDERFGPRFLAMSDAYDEDLSRKFKECMVQLGHGSLLHEGVYIMVGGPTFSTTAEYKVLRSFGADAVGMSTIPEVVVGRHSNMRVFGLSLITDTANYECSKKNVLTHEDVLEIANTSAKLLQKVFSNFINMID